MFEINTENTIEVAIKVTRIWILLPIMLTKIPNAENINDVTTVPNKIEPIKGSILSKRIPDALLTAS